MTAIDQHDQLDGPRPAEVDQRIDVLVEELDGRDAVIQASREAAA